MDGPTEAELDAIRAATFTVAAVQEREAITDHRIVQESAQRAWDTSTPLRDLLGERDLGLDLDAIFDLGAYTHHADEIVDRLNVLQAQG
jgi:adenylosuccinate lyase